MTMDENSSGSNGQLAMMSREVVEVHNGSFIESWISDISRTNKEHLNFCIGSSSSSNSTSRMFQMNVFNGSNLLCVPDIDPQIKFPPSSTLSFGINYLGNNESLIRQGYKRQQSQSVATTEPRPDAKQLNFEKSVVQLQEKNSELMALIEHQRQQNHLHKQISFSGLEAPGIQWPDLENHGNVASQPCLDGDLCAQRLMKYLFQLGCQPINNDISFWRNLISEYYAPCAKKRLCLSVCENISERAMNLFTDTKMGFWCCGLCGSKPRRGFEVAYEALPRLFKTNFDSGMLNEMVFLGVPQEHRFSSGLITLEYDKTVQESVYENFRVVHEGKLRVSFTDDLKIISWEFCIQRHEVFLQRRALAEQIDNLVDAAQNCDSTMNNFDDASPKDINSFRDIFTTAERELASNMELPMLNDLGFSKKYFRCLQMAEAFDSMRDLMTVSQELSIGPIESLKNYHRLKKAKEHEIAPNVVVRTYPHKGLRVADNYSQLFGQDSFGSVARIQKQESSYSTAYSGQIEFLNDKLPLLKETTCRVYNLGTTNGAAKASEASGISDTIMLTNAMNFSENAALAIAQANLIANAQMTTEMCKAAFKGSSSTINMSVKVEPRFQEQV